jgi:hypothetical protein
MGSKFIGKEKHDSFILYVYTAAGGLLWQF